MLTQIKTAQKSSMYGKLLCRKKSKPLRFNASLFLAAESPSRFARRLTIA